MKLVKEWWLPIETVSEMNRQEHWSKRAKRFKKQKKRIALAFLEEPLKLKLPVHIRIIRYSSQTMDADNVNAALKGVRDAMADQILPGFLPGRADSDPRITWEYEQEKGKNGFLRIQFYELTSTPSNS